METLINHLWYNNRDEIVKKSLSNCHTEGLDSIMLLDSPDKTIRLFYAHPHHELWRNYKHIVAQGGELSVGFHPHHCVLTLSCVLGEFTDWSIKSLFSHDSLTLNEYKYTSQILHELPMRFEKIREAAHFVTNTYKTLKVGDSISMAAWMLHTVAVPVEREAAWLVFEGKENTKHKPICFSNKDLTKLDNWGLYQPMPERDIQETLEKIWGKF